MVYKFFNKKSFGGAIKNEVISNNELAEDLHKPVITTFRQTKSIFIFYRQYLES